MNVCKPQRRRLVFPLIVQEQDDTSSNRPAPIDDPFQEATVPARDLFLVTTDASSIMNTKLPRVRKRRRGTFPCLATNMRALNSNHGAIILHHSRSSPSLELDREGEDTTTTSSSTVGIIPLSLELAIDAILLAW